MRVSQHPQTARSDNDSIRQANARIRVSRKLSASEARREPARADNERIRCRDISYHWPMVIEELTPNDASDAIGLWEMVGLIRPWNGPDVDFSRALHGTTSTVLGARETDGLVGTAMVGWDGHRGWVYYLAVAPSRQRQGIGAQLMTAAENWLRAQGAAKVQLMVRDTNDEARHFYERRGYEDASVTVMARWLTSPSG